MTVVVGDNTGVISRVYLGDEEEFLSERMSKSRRVAQ